MLPLFPSRVRSFVVVCKGDYSHFPTYIFPSQVQEAEAKRKADRAAKFEQGRRLKQVRVSLASRTALARNKRRIDLIGKCKGANSQWLMKIP